MITIDPRNNPSHCYTLYILFPYCMQINKVAILVEVVSVSMIIEPNNLSKDSTINVVSVAKSYKALIL